MTKRQISRERRRVMQMFQRWKTLFGLQHWDIQIHLFTERIPPAEGDEDDGPFIADCHVKWEYLCAVIRWDMSRTWEKDDAEVEGIVVHELLHVVVNEMRHSSSDDGIYHEERVVTHLGLILQWAMDEGYRLGKRDSLQAPGRE